MTSTKDPFTLIFLIKNILLYLKENIYDHYVLDRNSDKVLLSINRFHLPPDYLNQLFKKLCKIPNIVLINRSKQIHYRFLLSESHFKDKTISCNLSKPYRNSTAVFLIFLQIKEIRLRISRGLIVLSRRLQNSGSTAFH